LPPVDPARVAAIGGLLAEAYPNAVVELDHKNAYELLVATILAAQSTDKNINTLTPALFARYPDANALAQADQAEVEPMIFKSGFFRNKAKAIIGMAQAVVTRHGGQVPRTMAELVELPGVARKTANVVLGEALGINEGFTVDTHVSRLGPRLGFTRETDPVKIEQDMMRIVPQAQWAKYAQRLIWHGRRVCHAKMPDCEHCLIAPHCPSAFHAVEEAKENAQRAIAQAKKTRAATLKAAKAAAKGKKPAAKKPAKAKKKSK
jgi:endonuclease-3